MMTTCNVAAFTEQGTLHALSLRLCIIQNQDFILKGDLLPLDFPNFLFYNCKFHLQQTPTEYFTLSVLRPPLLYNHWRCWIPSVSLSWRRVDKNLYQYKLFSNILWVYCNCILLFQSFNLLEYGQIQDAVMEAPQICSHKLIIGQMSTLLPTWDTLPGFINYVTITRPQSDNSCPSQRVEGWGTPGCSGPILLFSYSTQMVLLEMENLGFSFLAFSVFVFLTEIILKK